MRPLFRSGAGLLVLIWTGLATQSYAVRPDASAGALRMASPLIPASIRVPSQEQARLAQEAATTGSLVEWNTELGTPSLIRARDLRPSSPGVAHARSASAPEQEALSVLENISGLMGARAPASEFALRDAISDGLGYRHMRMNQIHNGLRVVGGQIIVHFNASGEAYQVNGRYVADINVEGRASISADQALFAAVRRLESAGSSNVAPVHLPELVVFALNTEPVPAYEMILSCSEADGRYGRRRFWISAINGSVILAIDDIKRVVPPTDKGRPATVSGSILVGEGGSATNLVAWYESAGRYYLHNTNQCWYIFNYAGAGYADNNTYAYRATSEWGATDRTEFSAANNFRHIQNYFRTMHGRASYDTSNAMARVNVHYGQNYVNAFWDGSSFNFGDGNNVEATSLAVLDVSAHEYGHAVTEHTADLFYFGESGALNESYSDIWAACVEFYAQPDGRSLYPNVATGKADWLIGEDCWLDGTALRDMRNPGSFVTLTATNRQPSRYKGTNWLETAEDFDYGGVHRNSGVQNFMFYLLSDGGNGVNDSIPYSVNGIGVTNAAKLAYRALTVYFTTYTDFSEARRCWVSAARDINSNWVASVEAAWDAVGVAGDQLSASLAEAVNAPSLPWYTGGSVANNWFAQSEETVDGVLAARSGLVAHKQDTRIMTFLRGPGRISYYWKVSSQANSDFLLFYIDNQLTASISGNIQWHQKTHELPGGLHSLKWVYQKDASLTVGADAGWLDLFSWTPYVPEKPMGFYASDGATSAGVRLAWQSARYADWYEIWRASSSEPGQAAKIAETSATSFLDSDVAPLQITYYWVVPSNPNMTGPWSECDFGYRSLPPPQGVTASSGVYNDSIQVSWQAVDNAAVYEIWRSLSPSFSTAAPLNTNLSALVYRDTTAVSGLPYYYWVRARGFVVSTLPNIGDFSAPATGWRFVPPPDNVRASNGEFTDKVRVTWSDVAGASSYEIWRALVNDRNYAVKVSSVQSPQYDDTATLIDVSYYYWVRTIAAVGASQFSSSDFGWRASPTVPAAPTNVVASDGTYSNKVRVSWSRVDFANSYEIWRANTGDIDAAKWVENTYGTRYDDFNVIVGKPYYYWIKAKGDGGIGGFSDPDSGYAFPSGIPEPVDHAYNDYNGDGATDLAVYNSASGLWYVSTAYGIIVAWNFPWGGQGLRPAPGDYRGDGFTEYAVYNPVTGKWFIRTGAGLQIAWDLPWGGGGLISVYGDYDGDGISDLAVYDTASGAWYIRSVSGRIILWAGMWGGKGLWPVPGDYDGDARSDLAVYEPASGAWYVLSMLGYAVISGELWGGPGFEPVMGDYNGDMLSDMAVYDRNAGTWYIKTIYGTYLALGEPWGGSGFVPVAGDFNGDGRYDMAVYHPATGYWYIRTLNGFLITWALPLGGPGFEVVRGAPAVW